MNRDRHPGTRKLSIPPLPEDARRSHASISELAPAGRPSFGEKARSEWDDEDRLTRIYDRASKAPPPMSVLESSSEAADEVTTAANIAPAELEALRLQLRIMEVEARNRASALSEHSPEGPADEGAPDTVGGAERLQSARPNRRVFKWLVWPLAIAAISLGALTFPSLRELRQLLPSDYEQLLESLDGIEDASAAKGN